MHTLPDDSHPDRQRNFKCDHCGLAFREARILENHIIVKHTSEHIVPRIYRNSLIVQTTYLGNEEATRRYGCDICGKRFVNTGNMSNHRRRHLR